MKIVDKYTIDLYMKSPSEIPSWAGFTPVQFLPAISKKIIPEHYLNQSQLEDEKTPDITHSSWEKFSSNCFGTGLFEISNFNPGVETTLLVKPSCWWLNSTIIDDPLLNWSNRFGDFTSDLDQLRVRMISYAQPKLLELEAGKLDLIPIDKPFWQFEPHIEFQARKTWTLTYFAYNIRSTRPIFGSQEPCPGDPSLSIGLAVRKAVSYAMNREEMNEVIHGDLYHVSNQPIFERLGIWCNPNIIQYNHDLDRARELMTKAGFELEPPSEINGMNFYFMTTISIIGIVTFIVYRKRRME